MHGFDPHRPTIREIGEFQSIDRLAGLLPASAAAVGIGDDAAVLDIGGPDYLLATIDMMVENVHFVAASAPPDWVGRRALAANVSDIAAMGGTPLFALISLAVPPSLSMEWIEMVYKGLAREAAVTGTSIVGGNTSRTDGPICIDVSVLGTVPRDEVVLRSGGRPGDVLAVTGRLGETEARRLWIERAMQAEASPDETPLEPAVATSRVGAGRALAAGHLARAMLDLSDGLAGDLQHLCRSSDVGAVIYSDRLPISAWTREAAARLNVDATSLALNGGEDYELLIAVDPSDLDRARTAIAPVPLAVVGELVDSRNGLALIDSEGDVRVLQPSGWTHF